MTKKVDWNSEAKNVLKSILKRKDIEYQQLSNMLKQIGINESPGAINSKINRGTFSFMFFMQCMKVLKMNKINLD